MVRSMLRFGESRLHKGKWLRSHTDSKTCLCITGMAESQNTNTMLNLSYLAIYIKAEANLENPQHFSAC